MNSSSCSSESQQTSYSSEKRHKGANWTEEETKVFIDLCSEKRVIQMMDGKRYKHIDIYNSLEPLMREMGFIKTGAQMKTKLKHLKEIYFKCKRRNNVSGAGRSTFPFYDAMEELLGGRPSAQAIADVGIDSSNSSIQETTEEDVSEMEETDASESVNAVNDLTVAKTVFLRKKKTTGGRNSYIQIAENFAEIFAEKQAEKMQQLMTEQMLMFEQTIKEEMETQRQWEKELMEQEHRHQFQIMEQFMQNLSSMQQNQFQYPQHIQLSQHNLPSTSSNQYMHSPTSFSPPPSFSRFQTPVSPYPRTSSPATSPIFIKPCETNVSAPPFKKSLNSRKSDKE